MSSARGITQPTDYVKLAETPSSLHDRSQGDIHAGGNPHIDDPRNVLPVGKALADRFAELDGQCGISRPLRRLRDQVERRWPNGTPRPLPLRGQPIVQHGARSIWRSAG